MGRGQAGVGVTAVAISTAASRCRHAGTNVGSRAVRTCARRAGRRRGVGRAPSPQRARRPGADQRVACYRAVWRTQAPARRPARHRRAATPQCLAAGRARRIFGRTARAHSSRTRRPPRFRPAGRTARRGRAAAPASRLAPNPSRAFRDGPGAGPGPIHRGKPCIAIPTNNRGPQARPAIPKTALLLPTPHGRESLRGRGSRS